MAEQQRDTTPVTVNLERRRGYRSSDTDRRAQWVGPGKVEVPAWVAQEWGIASEATTAEATKTGAAPFENYNELTVDDVVERLDSLNDAERAAVRAYETANKNRRGVLEALDGA